MNIEIVKFPKANHTSEIYQPTGFHFSFVSEDNKQCHEMIKCRDFLQDAVRATLHKKPCSIYGFVFDAATNPPPDFKKTKMLVTRMGKPADPQIYECSLKILRTFEKHHGIKPMSAMYTTNIPEHVLFKGSSEWIASPFMISLYSMLIRLGDKKIEFKNYAELIEGINKIIKGGGGDNDINYLRRSTTAHLELCLEHRKEFLFSEAFGEKISISSFHNSSGVVAFCSGHTADAALNTVLQKLFAAGKVEKPASKNTTVASASKTEVKVS